MQVMSDIPSVIYIQGLLDSIARYYISGLTRAEQIYCRGLLDMLSVNPVEKARRSYERRAFDETKMIRQSKNVIVENNWCAAHCLAVESKCRVFRSKLPIREEFFRAKWVPEQMIPHTIMCNTSGYPIKGLHVLLRALSLIVQEFPDAVLKIPGISFLPRQGFLGRFRGQGYARLIKRLIDVLGLQKNIKFLGLIPTSEGVASEMASSNVFVMPSSIENHSSTLIEAMIVGVPCVASDVGGVGELIEHGETGFLYRFEEYELLAQHVCRLFREQSLACRIGTCAREVMRTQRASGGVKDEFLSIYQSILESERGRHT
jgi:glycosyltransferase involved in cell wall biosynthesis